MAFPVALETYIQKEVTIKDQISALKNEVNTVAKDALDAKKASVDALKSQVNSNISALDAITDANAVAKKTEVKEKLENHLKTLDEIDHVLQVKKNVAATPDAIAAVENDPEKKGNFLTNYLSKVTSKDEWKKEPIANVSRVVTWIGATSLLLHGFNWLRKKMTGGEKKEESKTSTKEADNNAAQDEKDTNVTVVNESDKSKMPRWAKLMVWAGIVGGAWYAAMNWDQIKQRWKEKKEGVVSIEDSIINMKGDLAHASEGSLNIEPNVECVEPYTILKSYGQEIAIDPIKKTVQWIDGIVFPDFKQMLHAANMVNFCATAYRGKCSAKEPFDFTSLWGDLSVLLADKSEQEVVSAAGVPMWKIAWGALGTVGALLAGFYGWPKLWLITWAVAIPGGIAAWNLLDHNDTISKICPALNTSVAKQKFRACLNKLPNLIQWNNKPENVTESPLKKYILEVEEEIRDTHVESSHDQVGIERHLDAKQDPSDPTLYTIWSYNFETKMHFIDGKITIEWLDITFTDPKEGIRVANLTNKLKKEYAGKGGDAKEPFRYANTMLESTMTRAGVYNFTPWLKFYPDAAWYPEKEVTVVSKDALEKHMPHLLQDIKTKYIPYLHTLRTSVANGNRPLWSS
jgi:hypothetical protein